MDILKLVLIALILAINLQHIVATRPLTSTVVFSKGEGGYYCHKIPYLLRTLSGSLIALAEGRGKDGREACDDFSGTDLVFKRSTDNGKTWSTIGVFYTNSSDIETNVVGNVAPVQDRDTGRIWMPFCRNNEEVYISYSDDDGMTWTSPVYHPELTHSDWKWIGLGPPGGIQLASGRLLIPSYHTIRWKGDGCVSRGHTIFSDNHGATWSIGSSEFGAPYLANECQAIELKNGSVLINSRTLTNRRVQVISNDGGKSFEQAYEVAGIHQPMEGCEGSLVRQAKENMLYFSAPYSTSVVRMNMTIYRSDDEGLNWEEFKTVDRGAVAYSSLQIDEAKNALEILYERSDNVSLVFEPDQIVFWRIQL